MRISYDKAGESYSHCICKCYIVYIYNIKSCILHDDAHKHYFYLYHAIIIMIILWLFFHITTTQYLTALALVQDYRRHLAYSSPPPHAHVV